MRILFVAESVLCWNVSIMGVNDNICLLVSTTNESSFHITRLLW